MAPTDEPTSSDSSEPGSSTALPGATEEATSTTAPTALMTSPPDETNTEASSATAIPTSSAIPDPSATLEPSPTLDHTVTSIPNMAPTATSSPVNYCSNINWISHRLEDWQNKNAVWKFVFFFANNNTIPMYLTNYTISWNPDTDLHLNRTKTIRFPGSNRPKLVKSQFASPGTCPNCSDATIEYPAQSGQAAIYNMFCSDWPCDENKAVLEIPQANYSLTANATFTFYGPSGTVSCPKTWTASGMAPPK